MASESEESRKSTLQLLFQVHCLLVRLISSKPLSSSRKCTHPSHPTMRPLAGVRGVDDHLAVTSAERQNHAAI